MLDSNLRRLAFDDLIPLAAHRQRRIQDQDMPHDKPIEESPQRRQVQFPSGQGHWQRIEKPTNVGRCHADQFQAACDAPIGEQANGVQIRLPRKGIADLSVKELLECESSRPTGLPNQRRQFRWFSGGATAAKFLEEFVQETPWVHIDIAGPSFLESPKPWLDAGGSGAFVRTLVEVARGWRG